MTDTGTSLLVANAVVSDKSVCYLVVSVVLDGHIDTLSWKP